MKIDIHQVDAFAESLFGGNPAGVVTNADGLSDEIMIKIAREMNLSETAFVLSPSQDAHVKLRYFTPTDEIKFCGHATVGALYELARLGMYSLGDPGINAINVETNAGLLSMSVSRHGDAQPHITFMAPDVSMETYRLQGEAFAHEFGIAADTLMPKGEILIDSILNYVYIPIISLEALGSLSFNFAQIRERFASEHIVVFCLYTSQTQQPASGLHARGLAPLVGVDEDPFTGSMQAGLIHAAKQNNLVDREQNDIMVEQGDFIGRPGFARIHHDRATNTLEITAQATQVFSTTMEV